MHYPQYRGAGEAVVPDWEMLSVAKIHQPDKMSRCTEQRRQLLVTCLRELKSPKREVIQIIPAPNDLNNSDAHDLKTIFIKRKVFTATFSMSGSLCDKTYFLLHFCLESKQMLSYDVLCLDRLVYIRNTLMTLYMKTKSIQELVGAHSGSPRV